jgi:hypothetical protein
VPPKQTATSGFDSHLYVVDVRCESRQKFLLTTSVSRVAFMLQLTPSRVLHDVHSVTGELANGQ